MRKIISYLKTYNWEVAIWLLTVTCVIILLLAFLSGCKPSEQVKRSRALQFYNEHPSEFAKNCADAFPVKDSVGDEVIDSIKAADNLDLSLWLNSLYGELDALREKLDRDTNAMARRYTDQINVLVGRMGALNQHYKPCEPEIIYKSKPVYQENTARIKALGAQIDSLWQNEVRCKEREQEALKQAERYKKRASSRLWAIIVLTGVIVAYVILQIKRIL